MKPLLSFELTLMYVGDRTGFHLSSLSPRISGDKGDGIENATNGHSQGGGVEKVGAAIILRLRRLDLSYQEHLVS
jgi:hypothetical protein